MTHSNLVDLRVTRLRPCAPSPSGKRPSAANARNPETRKEGRNGENIPRNTIAIPTRPCQIRKRLQTSWRRYPLDVFIAITSFHAASPPPGAPRHFSLSLSNRDRRPVVFKSRVYASLLPFSSLVPKVQTFSLAPSRPPSPVPSPQPFLGPQTSASYSPIPL